MRPPAALRWRRRPSKIRTIRSRLDSGRPGAAQGRTIEAEALYEKGMQLTAKFSGNPKRKRNFEIRARSGRAAVASAARTGTPPSAICRRC